MYVILYLATIPAANWFIGHIGTTCLPNGPCVVPVFPGLTAPSGVMFVGVALLLRDLVQRQYGLAVSLISMAVGVVISFFVANPFIAAASAAAFAISEASDFLVYTPIAKKSFTLALVASCIVGGIVDSATFLWLAFGSLNFIAGQIVGKLYAVAAYTALRRLFGFSASVQTEGARQ